MRKVLLSLFLLSLSFFVFSQEREDVIEEIGHYLYDRDTVLVIDDHVYVVDNLGEKVNSVHSESGPRISPDGRSLYFFRVNHPENVKRTRDIWVSYFNEKDSTWSEAEHLGTPLNNYGDNSVHSIMDDGNALLLHNIYLKNGTTENGMSISRKDKSGKWSFPEKVKVKKYKNDDVCSFHMNNEETILLLAIHYKEKESYGNQDLYVSFKDKGAKKWSAPKNLGPIINTAGHEATAFLAADGVTLYFSSDGHPDNYGGYDIYKTTRLDSTWTRWSKPENMGSPFSTADDEFYFSIPDEGDYVYLAHHFIGEKDSVDHSDIVRIKLKPDPMVYLTGLIYDEYNKEPIEATIKFRRIADSEVFGDQVSKADSGYKADLPAKSIYEYTVEAEGYQKRVERIDFSKETVSITKKMDVYMKRNPALVLSGQIYDEKTMQPIGGEVVFIRKSDGVEVYRAQVHPDSSYNVTLPAGHQYDYVVKKEGYLPENKTIDIRGLKDYKVEDRKDILLKQIKKDLTFTINDIYFETAKATLLPESYVELDNLVKLLKDIPTVKVEISGHTDWVGNAAYNVKLSQSRAESVVKYLTNNGINKDKLVAKGYGKEKPIADNNTEEGRQLNRRVEFKVLEVE